MNSMMVSLISRISAGEMHGRTRFSLSGRGVVAQSFPNPTSTFIVI